MNMLPAVVAALLGLLIGVAHSSFAKSYRLAALYPNDAVKRRIITLIWHLPSLTWAALTLAVLLARLSGTSNAPLSMIAVFVFGVSGAGNLWAHKKPFIGGILLLITVMFLAMDWLTNL